MKIKCRTHEIGAAAAYTLAEVLLSVFVLGVMLISLYGGFSAGFAVVQLARENLRATQIMMQKMETVRLLKWSQLLDTANYLQPTFLDYYDPSSTNVQSAGAIYQGNVTLTAAAISGFPAYSINMREITVTIYWTNYPHGLSGTPIVRTRTMQTLAAQYGMQNYVYK